MNVTDFLLDAGIKAAEDTLADRQVFRLDEQRWKEFQNILDRPVVNNPSLVSAAFREERAGVMLLAY